jgi:hypothetical protein
MLAVEGFTEPHLDVRLGEHEQWEMFQIPVSDTLADKQTQGKAFARLQSRTPKKAIKAMAVGTYTNNVILTNTSDIPIKNASVIITALDLTPPIHQLDGLTNDAHRFSRNELTYDLRQILPYKDSGQQSEMTIAITPSRGNVALIVSVTGDNFHGIGAFLILQFSQPSL